MSKILDQDHQLYFKFQKIFNMFDIYLKRELVSDFLNNSNLNNNSRFLSSIS